MFLIDSKARISAHDRVPGADDPATTDAAAAFSTERGLADLIQTHPGDWAVKLWNTLADVEPTRKHIWTKKFRNRGTAVERIWNRLAELYPDAILPENMPRKKTRFVVGREMMRLNAKARKTLAPARKAPASAAPRAARTRQSWAAELTAALRKRFNPGDAFGLADVYKLVPYFQRRHPKNKNVTARLRATLAQDLRGGGVVKSNRRGRYVMRAA